MDQEPLVKDKIEAGAKLVREFDKFAPVKAAFWLMTSEDYRYLYIASEDFTDKTTGDGYAEILRLAPPLRSMDLNPFRVKLISADDPLAKAAVAVQEQFPEVLPTRIGPTMFGGTFVEDVYLYAPLEPAAVK